MMTSVAIDENRIKLMGVPEKYMTSAKNTPDPLTNAKRKPGFLAIRLFGDGRIIP
jgi:hypothetical protein